MKKIYPLFLALVLLAACRNEPKEVKVEKEINAGEADQLTAIVDTFYKALTGRDSAGVVALLADEVKLYGTDPAEDWKMADIRNYLGERMQDTTQKAVFTVKKREVRVMNNLMYVIDLLDVSTTQVPFRCLTIVEEKEGQKKIILSEFSALVRNEDMGIVDSLYKNVQSAQSVH